MAKYKTPKPTVRVALDAEEIDSLLFFLTAQSEELIKKLRLAKFKAENEISVSHTRTGKKATQAEAMLEAFDEAEFMADLEKIEASKNS